MDQGAGIGVFQHPQRAIGALFHIADAVAHIPALGGLAPPWPSKTMRLSVLVCMPRHRGSFAALERWQIVYLPVYAVWAALVVVVFPPVFGYR